MLDGLIFGLVDNGILAVCAVMGIDLDKRFSGQGVNGALFGALFGNALSDGLGALLDFSLLVTVNIVIGCLAVIPFVYWYVSTRR